MAERTYDEEDPRDLPYRFTYSLITDEIFIVVLGHGIGVSMMFGNRPAFRRFLEEGRKTEYLISEKVLQQAEDILKAKGELEGGG